MKVSPATRRKARHYGMQALYQWQMTQTPPHIIEAEFKTDNDMTHVARIKNVSPISSANQKSASRPNS